MKVVEKWLEKGHVSAEFAVWVSNENKVSFPWSMIDKITPRPAKAVEEALDFLDIDDMAPIVTSKNTFIAPFVNAERSQYLVIEDRFPNGRPPLEKVGVYLTDRGTVNKTEKMKVTTCLNPLHTALAVDDEGNSMECSSDPMLVTLQGQLSAVKLGDPVSASDKVLAPILSNMALFGDDLCRIGLAGKIGGMLREMLAGPGAVRDTLKKYLG